MTNLFLRLKHWQIFSLTFGLPIILQIFFMQIMFDTSNAENMVVPNDFNELFLMFGLIMIISISCLYVWYYSVATGLQAFIPEPLRPKIRKFKIFYFIPLLYITFILIAVISFVPQEFVTGPNLSSFFPMALLIIIPLHLFSIFCMLYIIYFVAKSIRTAELQQEVTFSNFIGEFFLIWFLPIGIWIIQPQINKIANNIKQGAIPSQAI